MIKIVIITQFSDNSWGTFYVGHCARHYRWHKPKEHSLCLHHRYNLPGGSPTNLSRKKWECKLELGHGWAGAQQGQVFPTLGQ